MVKNLPYFHVWFGLDKSFGHVIENEAEGFEPTFGREILAGMLEMPRNAAGPVCCNKLHFNEF